MQLKIRSSTVSVFLASREVINYLEQHELAWCTMSLTPLFVSIEIFINNTQNTTPGPLSHKTQIVYKRTGSTTCARGK